MRIVILTVALAFLCSCSTINPESTLSGDETLRRKIIGTWEYVDPRPEVKIYQSFYENGKQVVVARLGPTIVAYEAKWKIENGYLHEHVTKLLFEPTDQSSKKKKSKDRILSLTAEFLRIEALEAETFNEMLFSRIN